MTNIATPAGCYAFLDVAKTEETEKISWCLLARNISPSSDSGLGSEEEEQSAVYENVESNKTLSELTQELTINCDNDAAQEAGGYRWRGPGEFREDLSLLLTTQNPDRIDVKTLKRNKVSAISGQQ